MSTFLAYDLKVAVLIAVFYVFWRLLLANEKWHRLNRVVLLATAAASFVLPLCVITIHQTIEVEPVADSVVAAQAAVAGAVSPVAGTVPPAGATVPAEEPETPFDWFLPLTVLYVTGVVAVLSKTLLSLWRLRRIRTHSELYPLSAGREIAVSEAAETPFSWWNTVYLNRKDYEEGTTALLTHELEHIRLRHSTDVLLVEIFTALQWFNPTMWMLRADLRTIHEYEADQQVLSHGFNDIQYLHLLIRKAANQGGYSLANGISNSTLKKRITMMMKPRSNHWQWLRLAYILPVVAVSLYASCKTETDYRSKEESAIQLTERDGKEHYAIKAPVGAFHSWMVNGHLAERGVVEEDGRWNVRSYLPVENFVVTLDGKQIDKDRLPYVPLSSVKELKYLQGETPRRIELYTSPVSGFSRESVAEWPEKYKESVKSWMFFLVEDAATGRQIKGAEVSIEGTGQKALTNDEGWCELKVPLGSTVRVSCQGLESQTMKMDHISGDRIQGRTFWLYKPGQPIYPAGQLSRGQEPQFEGGARQWLARHISLPEDVRKEGRLRDVTVWAVIHEDGSVSGVRVRQGDRKELNDEAVRVVSSMPKWKPAVKDGKPVKSLTLVVVPFS